MELTLNQYRERRRRARATLEEKLANDFIVRLKGESYAPRHVADFDINADVRPAERISISPRIIDELSRYGRIKREYHYVPAVAITVDSDLREQFLSDMGDRDLQAIVESLEKNSVVGLPDEEFTASSLPSTDQDMWNLKMVEAYDARRMGAKGGGVEVCVIDTGADYTHPEIEDRFVHGKEGYNFVEDSDDPMDDNSHGTHCSGTIAGENVGIATACTLRAAKFLTGDGWGTLEDAIRAVEWAIDEGVDVTSNSWGSSDPSETLEEAFNAAWSRGIVSVAAAGNSGREDYDYPGAYRSVIGVAAVDSAKKRAYFSTMNDRLELSAPGVKVYSSVPNGRFAEYSGTSMACPHVSGGVAIVKGYYRARNLKIRENLKRNAEPLGDGRPNNKYGYGLLRIKKTLEHFA